MSLLKLGPSILLCLGASKSVPSPTVSEINGYVSQINNSTKLHQLYLNYKGKWGDHLRRDTIFWVHSTDFGCSAIISYADNSLVKVKEVVRTSSQMDIYQYYFQKNKVVFVDAVTVRCTFGKESPSLLYTEKDYLFHGKYYCTTTSLLTTQERGQLFHDYSWYTPRTGQPKRNAGFFAWQAARYVTLFSTKQ